MARYYVEMDGYQYGPFDLEELRQLTASGVLAGSSHVREEHASDSEVLVQLLANAPSPQPEDSGTAPLQGQSDQLQSAQLEPPFSAQPEPQAEDAETGQFENGGTERSQFAPENPVQNVSNARAVENPAPAFSWSERLAQLRGVSQTPGIRVQPAALNQPAAEPIRQPAYPPGPTFAPVPDNAALDQAASRQVPELGRFVPEQSQLQDDPAAPALVEPPQVPFEAAPTGQPAAMIFTPDTSAVPTPVWQETGSAPQAAAGSEQNFRSNTSVVSRESGDSNQTNLPANPAGQAAGPSNAGIWPPPAVFADLKLAPVGNDDAVEEPSSFSLPPLKYGFEETDLKTPSEWLEPPPPRPRPTLSFGDPDQDTEYAEVATPEPQMAAQPASPASPVPPIDPAAASVSIAGGLPAVPDGFRTVQHEYPAPQSAPATPPVPAAPSAPSVPAEAFSVQSRPLPEEEPTLSKEKLSRLDDIYGRSRPAPIVAQPETGAMRSSMQMQPVEPLPETAQEETEQPAARKTNLIAGLVLIGAGAVSLLAGSEYLNLRETCPGSVMALVLLAYGVLALIGGLLTWLEVRWAAPIIRILALIPLGVLLACGYYHMGDLTALTIPAFLQKPLMYNAITLLATVLGPAIWPGRSKTARTA